MTRKPPHPQAPPVPAPPALAPPALAPPALALEICRRIGANPAGPVGLRLIGACAAPMPGDAQEGGPDGSGDGSGDAPGDAARAREARIARLIDGATNRETYFFRDRRQLAALCALLAGGTAAAKGGPSVWSAGCATGEEAYSIAILLREAGLGGSVTATDVSRAALAAAEAALYRTGPMSPCREVKPADHAHLPALPDGRRTVAAAIRGMVRLREHNILSGPPSPCPFDAVLCRNVLIYMDDAARRTAFSVVAAAVRPGGLLLLGPGDLTPTLDPAAHGLRPCFHDGAALFVKDGPA
ncbi:CheR family methyltransferase [Azospirillum thiophilum]|uniref:CheR family methyltransferase n=1 Tax=Azospirillum thiophilum TaxID=528244 RepID=UPI0006986141|nr:CheR family methyltransferase [Azospirillum thiophilum]